MVPDLPMVVSIDRWFFCGGAIMVPGPAYGGLNRQVVVLWRCNNGSGPAYGGLYTQLIILWRRILMMVPDLPMVVSIDRWFFYRSQDRFYCTNLLKQHSKHKW